MNELYNIEEIKTLNIDLQAQNNELQSQYKYYLKIYIKLILIKMQLILYTYFFRLLKHQNDIKIYQTNEEELNKKIIKLKSKLKHMVRRSKQLTEENNIDNHVATLITEIKMKEDAFGVEKNELNTNNQCLKKKILAMEKDLDNMNSKVSVCL